MTIPEQAVEAAAKAAFWEMHSMMHDHEEESRSGNDPHYRSKRREDRS